MWIFGLFDHRLSDAFSSFWLGFLGFLFLPWTTLAYAIAFDPNPPIAPLGVQGFGWFLVILAFLVDLGSYFNGEKARRDRAS